MRRLTASAPGGVAVLEVRGPDAHRLLAELTDAALPAPGELRLVRLRRAASEAVGATAEDLDEALVVGIGVGCTELHLHGSPPLVDEVAELLGAARDEPRPTLEQRAEAAYADAASELAARVLVDQAGGALRDALEGALALGADARAAALRSLAERGAALARLFDPLRVALAGPANAGKSTLFNLLVGEERAVVSSLAGTTRDAVGAPGRLGPWPAYFIDTAGERDVEGQGQADVERSGQALARRVAGAADVRLWLTASGAGEAHAPPAQGGAAIDVRLRSLGDLAFGLGDGREDRPSSWPDDVISALAFPRATRARVEAVVLDAVGLPATPEWEPGSAVPFEPELLAAVRTAIRGDASQVEALLADGV